MWGCPHATQALFQKETAFSQRTLLTNFLIWICFDGYNQIHLYNLFGITDSQAAFLKSRSTVRNIAKITDT